MISSFHTWVRNPGRSRGGLRAGSHRAGLHRIGALAARQVPGVRFGENFAIA